MKDFLKELAKTKYNVIKERDNGLDKTFLHRMTIKSTGYCGGDAGHGGFIEIEFDYAGGPCAIDCNADGYYTGSRKLLDHNDFNPSEGIRIRGEGDWEIETILDMMIEAGKECEKMKKEFSSS